MDSVYVVVFVMVTKIVAWLAQIVDGTKISFLTYYRFLMLRTFFKEM
jgi:hypothetical protein